jgi:hypothetical protein
MLPAPGIPDIPTNTLSEAGLLVAKSYTLSASRDSRSSLLLVDILNISLDYG